MNKFKVVIIRIVVISALIWAGICRADPPAFEWKYSEPVIFGESHDPDTVILKDGRELSVWYKDLSTDAVFDWTAGRKLTLSYTPDDGLWLVDDATGKKDRIVLAAKDHPITVLEDRCETTNSSTYGALECIRGATEQWDKEMTRAYQTLLGLVPKDKQLPIVEAQRSWIKFRDAQTKSVGIAYNKQGTMWGIIASDQVMLITRNQAYSLWDYLSDTGFDPGDFADKPDDGQPQ